MRRENKKVIIGTIMSVLASFLMNLGTLEEKMNFTGCLTSLLMVIFLVVLPGGYSVYSKTNKPNALSNL